MPAAISIRDLVKRYAPSGPGPGKLALDGVSFSVAAGKTLAVVGESGSGKTTLLNAIAARSRPDSGCIEFRGRDGEMRDIYAMSEAQQRLLVQTLIFTLTISTWLTLLVFRLTLEL